MHILKCPFQKLGLEIDSTHFIGFEASVARMDMPAHLCNTQQPWAVGPEHAAIELGLDFAAARAHFPTRLRN